MFSTSEKNNLRFIFTEITIRIFGTFIMVIVNFIFWYCLAYFSISRRWRIWDSRETTEVFTSFCCICNKAMRSSSSENYVDYVWASCYIQQRQFLNFPYLPISEVQCFLLYWECWCLLTYYEQKEQYLFSDFGIFIHICLNCLCRRWSGRYRIFNIWKYLDFNKCFANRSLRCFNFCYVFNIYHQRVCWKT